MKAERRPRMHLSRRPVCPVCKRKGKVKLISERQWKCSRCNAYIAVLVKS